MTMSYRIPKGTPVLVRHPDGTLIRSHFTRTELTFTDYVKLFAGWLTFRQDAFLVELHESQCKRSEGAP